MIKTQLLVATKDIPLDELINKFLESLLMDSKINAYFNVIDIKYSAETQTEFASALVIYKI